MIYTIENRILIKFTYFHKKSIASKTYFLFMYVRDLPLLKRQTTCIQIQRDRKKFWDIKIFVLWIAYPWDIQQIRIPVYQIIGTFYFIPHPSCIDFTKKPTQTEKISSCLNPLQLASAMENLKHIFTAPEIVRKTEELINEGKLLQAHKQYVG